MCCAVGLRAEGCFLHWGPSGWDWMSGRDQEMCSSGSRLVEVVLFSALKETNIWVCQRNESRAMLKVSIAYSIICPVFPCIIMHHIPIHHHIAYSITCPIFPYSIACPVFHSLYECMTLPPCGMLPHIAAPSWIGRRPNEVSGLRVEDCSSCFFFFQVSPSIDKFPPIMVTVSWMFP